MQHRTQPQQQRARAVRPHCCSAQSTQPSRIARTVWASFMQPCSINNPLCRRVSKFELAWTGRIQQGLAFSQQKNDPCPGSTLPLSSCCRTSTVAAACRILKPVERQAKKSATGPGGCQFKPAAIRRECRNRSAFCSLDLFQETLAYRSCLNAIPRTSRPDSHD